MNSNASAIFKPFILFFIAILLYGCGGSDESTVPLINQEPLSFSIEDINIFIDETPPEVSLNGGSGSGAIEYSSSDIQVVEVNSITGELLIASEGSATITASKAADETYNIATAMLTITVSKREHNPSTPPSEKYTIGGSVIGLADSEITDIGLILQMNGENNLTINSDGDFTFSSSLTDNSSFDVFIINGPTCDISNGSGAVAKGNVTNIAISCNKIVLVSTDEMGYEVNNRSTNASISADGKYITYQSDASNLVEEDTNYASDVFIFDTQSKTTTRASINASGSEGDLHSSRPSISADGRFVVFDSSANNLVDDDFNSTQDVFVHDIQTGVNTRVSISTDGIEGDDWSYAASMSSDARFIAFESKAKNLTEQSINSAWNIFVHDRQTKATTIVSVDAQGNEGDDWSYNASISADGRYVAFASYASNLVDEDNNNDSDIFVHDRQTNVTTRVSVDSLGNETTGISLNARSVTISADGRYVGFASKANNLVDEDNNGTEDVFIHDRQSGTTTRVSVDSTGNEGNSDSFAPSISADGLSVVFYSKATNLTEGESNSSHNVFLHNTTSGKTTRLSESNTETGGNHPGFYPSISANGHFTVFHSRSSNLVEKPVSTTSNIFLTVNAQ